MLQGVLALPGTHRAIYLIILLPHVGFRSTSSPSPYLRLHSQLSPRPLTPEGRVIPAAPTHQTSQRPLPRTTYALNTRPTMDFHYDWTNFEGDELPAWDF